jgi:hypothetical protein
MRSGKDGQADAPRERRHNRSTGVAGAERPEAAVTGSLPAGSRDQVTFSLVPKPAAPSGCAWRDANLTGRRPRGNLVAPFCRSGLSLGRGRRDHGVACRGLYAVTPRFGFAFDSGMASGAAHAPSPPLVGGPKLRPRFRGGVATGEVLPLPGAPPALRPSHKGRFGRHHRRRSGSLKPDCQAHDPHPEMRKPGPTATPPRPSSRSIRPGPAPA